MDASVHDGYDVEKDYSIVQFENQNRHNESNNSPIWGNEAADKPPPAYNQNHGVLIQETHALKKAVKIATS